MNEPNCPTTILPSRFAISGNSSCCSRIPGDIAVRNSTVSISKRALRRALSMMSIVTLSTFTFFIGLRLRWTILAGMGGTPREAAEGSCGYLALRATLRTTRFSRETARAGRAAVAFFFDDAECLSG